MVEQPNRRGLSFERTFILRGIARLCDKLKQHVICGRQNVWVIFNSDTSIDFNVIFLLHKGTDKEIQMNPCTVYLESKWLVLSIHPWPAL